jgi:hypothetical protein
MKTVLIPVIAMLFLVGCGSTKIVKSWQEPGASVSLTGDYKALVVAMVKDESSRRIVEDQLAKRLLGKGVASYTMLTSDMIKASNEDALTEMLTKGNFTHILLMRLGDVDKEVNYVPGSTTGFYGGYGRYYGYGAGFYSNPGYYTTDKNYIVETTVYTVKPDKLIYTATTTTLNPTNMEKTINEIADVVADKMKSDGFLK